MNSPNFSMLLCSTVCWRSWMALMDNSPCVLCVFQYFSLSAERENHQSYSCQSFSSLEKKRWCTRLFGNSYPCLLMLISFRLVLALSLSLSLCKATQSKETQSNSNGDAIQCKRKKRKRLRDNSAIWGCLCIADSTVSLQRLSSALGEVTVWSDVIWNSLITQEKMSKIAN